MPGDRPPEECFEVVASFRRALAWFRRAGLPKGMSFQKLVDLRLANEALPPSMEGVFDRFITPDLEAKPPPGVFLREPYPRVVLLLLLHPWDRYFTSLSNMPPSVPSLGLPSGSASTEKEAEEVLRLLDRGLATLRSLNRSLEQANRALREEIEDSRLVAELDAALDAARQANRGLGRIGATFEEFADWASSRAADARGSD